MATRPRSNMISALTARTQLGQIMKRASERNERFLVCRSGEPKVMIMGIRDYVRTIAPAPEWLREIRAEAKRKGLDKLTMRQIDAEITAARREQRNKNASSERRS
jgi:prevent-host-death family protein